VQTGRILSIGLIRITQGCLSLCFLRSLCHCQNWGGRAVENVKVIEKCWAVVNSVTMVTSVGPRILFHINHIMYGRRVINTNLNFAI